MTRARVRSILLLALAGGVLVDVVAPGNAAGVNAPLVLAALLAAAFAVAGPDRMRRMDHADAWLAPAGLALAGMAALRADDWLVLADLAFAAALAAGAIACLAGGRVTRGLLPHVAELAIGVVAAAVVGSLTLLGGSRLSPGDATAAERGPAPVPDPAGTRRRRLRASLARATPVLRGLLLALPIVIAFAMLFALADAVFARLAGDLLAWRPEIELADIAGRALVVGLVAWTAAGLLALGAGLLPGLMPQAGPRLPVASFPAGRSLGAASASERSPQAGFRLGTAEAATVLAAVTILFATFVGLQVAYLFGGHDTMALAGITYAEYARRGFFELVLVAVLAGLLVVSLDLAVLRRSTAQLGASLVLLTLTAVVLVSALVRLRLYQDAYGWTELRFVVLTAIGWLAVALAIAAALLVARRSGWILHGLGILTLVTIGAMNLVGPQAFVAGRNLERAIDPSLVPAGGRTGFDARYLEELGDEAVPSVLAALPLLSDAERGELAPFLARRLEALRTDPAYAGWPAWNLARLRAREALASWEAGSER